MSIPSEFEEFIRSIDQVSYFKRRLLIARLAKQEGNRFLIENRFLYKYMTLAPDNEDSINYTRDILVRSRLWLSSPEDFNDPFDMSIRISITPNIQEQRERINNMLKERGVPYHKRKKIILRFVMKPLPEREKFFNDTYQNHLKKVGVFSFAGDPKNNVMWSHYAKDHTGICVQLERARDFKLLSSAVRVGYTEEYPVATWGKDFEKSLQDALLQKEKKWSYEQESRIVRPGWANNYIPIRPKAVVGIIMGCKSKEVHHTIINEILEERSHAGLPSVRLYRAEKSNTGYKLSVYRK